jgi:hypothetical protein
MVFTNDNFILHLKECGYRFDDGKATKKEFENMTLKVTKYCFKDRGKYFIKSKMFSIINKIIKK